VLKIGQAHVGCCEAWLSRGLQYQTRVNQSFAAYSTRVLRFLKKLLTMDIWFSQQ
jgi:hypothetical protein